MDARVENGKLFDWKRSGAYAWKACFPLGNGARPAAQQQTAPSTPTKAAKKD